MRDFRIVIPSDCIASEDAESNRQVLVLMKRVLKADITPSAQLKFENTEIVFPRSSAALKPRRDQRIYPLSGAAIGLNKTRASDG
jgi:hypothetical protein